MQLSLENIPETKLGGQNEKVSPSLPGLRNSRGQQDKDGASVWSRGIVGAGELPGGSRKITGLGGFASTADNTIQTSLRIYPLASEELLLLEYFTTEGVMHRAGADCAYRLIYSPPSPAPLWALGGCSLPKRSGLPWAPQASANGRLQQEAGGWREVGAFLPGSLPASVSWTLVVPPDDSFWEPSRCPHCGFQPRALPFSTGAGDSAPLARSSGPFPGGFSPPSVSRPVIKTFSSEPLGHELCF